MCRRASLPRAPGIGDRTDCAHRIFRRDQPADPQNARVAVELRLRPRHLGVGIQMTRRLQHLVDGRRTTDDASPAERLGLTGGPGEHVAVDHVACHTPSNADACATLGGSSPWCCSRIGTSRPTAWRIATRSRVKPSPWMWTTDGWRPATRGWPTSGRSSRSSMESSSRSTIAAAFAVRQQPTGSIAPVARSASSAAVNVGQRVQCGGRVELGHWRHHHHDSQRRRISRTRANDPSVAAPRCVHSDPRERLPLEPSVVRDDASRNVASGSRPASRRRACVGQSADLTIDDHGGRHVGEQPSQEPQPRAGQSRVALVEQLSDRGPLNARRVAEPHVDHVEGSHLERTTVELDGR